MKAGGDSSGTGILPVFTARSRNAHHAESRFPSPIPQRLPRRHRCPALPFLAAADFDVSTDPHRFALLSDIHIHVDPAFLHKSKIGVTDMWKNLQQASGEILALSSRPCAIFINGDCAFHQGLPGDYMTVVDAFAALRTAKFPIHLALGNHDDRSNFWEVLPADDAQTMTWPITTPSSSPPPEPISSSSTH